MAYHSSYTGPQIDQAVSHAVNMDVNPTAGHTDRVVSSGGVKSALDAKADKNDLATIHQTSPTCTETNGIAADVFFYLDNELVVAKTAIANGATFTSGTNYESPTAGGLNALKSAMLKYKILTNLSQITVPAKSDQYPWATLNFTSAMSADETFVACDIYFAAQLDGLFCSHSYDSSNTLHVCISNVYGSAQTIAAEQLIAVVMYT